MTQSNNIDAPIPSPFKIGDRIFDRDTKSKATVTEITERGFKYKLDAPETCCHPLMGTTDGGEVFCYTWSPSGGFVLLGPNEELNMPENGVQSVITYADPNNRDVEVSVEELIKKYQDVKKDNERLNREVSAYANWVVDLISHITYMRAIEYNNETILLKKGLHDYMCGTFDGTQDKFN